MDPRKAYYLAAGVFALVAVVQFVIGTPGLGVVFLAVGAVFVALAGNQARRR